VSGAWTIRLTTLTHNVLAHDKSGCVSARALWKGMSVKDSCQNKMNSHAMVTAGLIV